MQPRQTLQILHTLQRLSCTQQTLQPRQPRQPRRPPPRMCCAQVVQQLLTLTGCTLTLTLPLTLIRCSSCSP